MAIRTIYEISKPDQQFYSVERAGYTTISEAAVDIGTDLVKLGAFTLANLSYETNIGGTLKTVGSTSWPPADRNYRLSNPGVGYKVGDKLQIVGGTGSAPFSITVSSIDNPTGKITSFAVDEVGIYSTIPGPAANLPLEYISPTATVAELEILGNLTASVGAGIVPPAPTSSIPGNNGDQWKIDYGNNGGGGNLGTRWPQNGAWVLSTTAALTHIKPGANVFIVSGDESSSIPTSTTVASLYTQQVVIGLTNVNPRYWAPPIWAESTTAATFVVFSQPVTLKKGDKIGFRGVGAQFDNTLVIVPNNWTGIFEAAGAVDPLNDSVGVFGNVALSTSNSNQVQITNILTTNTYNPVIYEGHTVSSLPDDPSPVPPNITVVSVDNYYETSGGVKTFKANVTLSSNISLASNKTLRFRFAQPQPWRLALQVQKNTSNPAAGSQVLNVYAATDLQLPDNGVISKVQDSNGTHVDWAGLMGDVWSAPASGRPDNDNVSQGFYNRQKRVGQSPENYPLNYSVTLTNRGVFVGMWEGNWSTMQKAAVSTTQDNFFNWFLIQRAVNRLTGKIVTTGRCPVFCINAVGYKYWKFIVREEDVIHPTVGPADSKHYKYNDQTGVLTVVNTPYRVPADHHTVDSFAVLNTTYQVSLTEDSKYLLGFINNLTTPRFRYSDELDMIGQTSADVVGQGVELSINAYGQSLPRYYRALPANNKYNTGLRICVLKDIPPA